VRGGHYVSVIRRIAPITAAALLTLGALAGCSGDNGDNDTSDQPSQSPTEATSDPDEPYLPVPAGVELTEPGSELVVGESAVIAWQPRQDLVGVLDVDVTQLVKTSFVESFEGWDVKAEQKKDLTPYFVHVTAANRGDTNLSGRLVPLYAVDSTDTLVEPTKFTDEFKPCPTGNLPEGFAGGDSVDVCLVYLIAAGQELTGVTFRPNQEFEPITWTGEIERIEKPKKDEKGDQGGDRDEG